MSRDNMSGFDPLLPGIPVTIQSYDKEPLIIKECIRDRCFNQRYDGELCKLHTDMEWYRNGAPNHVTLAANGRGRKSRVSA